MKKLSFLLVFGLFSLVISGCGNSDEKADFSDSGELYVLSDSECYDEQGKLQGNIQKDNQGNNINCYNENWEQEGRRIEYYDNEQIKFEGAFKDGRQDGKWVRYYESGQVKEEQNYNYGRQDGKEVKYYENGQVSDAGNYRDGKVDGKRIGYYEIGGGVSYEGSYENGEPVGERVWYGIDGKAIRVENY